MTQNPWRQTDLPRMMRRVYGMPAIALDNGAALEVVDGQWRLFTSLPGARGQKCFWKDGTWHQQLLPEDGVFRPLEELLAGAPTRTPPPDPTYYKRNELTHENSDAHLLCPLFGLLH